MELQIRELDELGSRLGRMSKVAQLSLGEDHARWGGSARVALERGTTCYQIGFAEQAYAQMQSSRMWADQQKADLKNILNGEFYKAALEIIGNLNGEE